ncbi:unnamed protein product [Dovyalis caffra]|uniref:Uncharacterized protein n=1 Tax=Dovyalis caffra TaxID=77055 RepID=A0AAV1QYM4_9ROSI|nr:unnamed protein product [Dovyalis caffra]
MDLYSQRENSVTDRSDNPGSKAEEKYSEAFSKHEKSFHSEMGRVENWRADLKEAADLAGIVLQDRTEWINGFLPNYTFQFYAIFSINMISRRIHVKSLTSSRLPEQSSWP